MTAEERLEKFEANASGSSFQKRVLHVET